MTTRLATFVALVVAMLSSSTFAQLPHPRLYALSPAGGQAGATFDAVIASGADTDDARALLFSHPGITATAKMMPATGAVKTPVKLENQFTVTINKDVPPGVYEVRVAGALGVSNTRAFVVSDLPESKDPGSNRDEKTAAPITPGTLINGVFTARGINYYKLTLKKDQRVMIDCKAERIDSRGNAVLILLHNGREIERQRAGNGLDPFIDFTAPADGDYIVAAHDLTYAGGDQYFYRLAVRTGPYIDYIFPPAGLAGTKGTYTLFGRNLPGGKKTDQVSIDGSPLEALDVQIDIPADSAGKTAIDTLVLPAEAASDAIVYRLAAANGTSNPMRLFIAQAQVTAEIEPNDDPAKAMKVTLPCEIAGRFTPRSDRDWFTFDAKKGEVLWLEVYCQRMGVAGDATLVVQQVKKTDKGEEIKDIQIADDAAEKPDPRFPSGTEDPTVRLTIPEDGTYRVQVRDQYASGKVDPRRVYRLAIQPESKDGSLPGSAAPDFRLVAAPPMLLPDKTKKDAYDAGATVMRRGGGDDLTILVYRRGGFDGDIELSVEGLPAGVACSPVIVPAGAAGGTLVFKAAGDAAAWAGNIHVIGKAKAAGKDIVREARGSQIVWGPVNDKSRGWSRLAGSIAVAVIDSERVPYTVTMGATTYDEVSRMGKLTVPIKVERHDGFKGPIKVTATTGIANSPVAGKEITIAPDKTDGVIEIEVKQAAAVQGYSLLVSADSAIQYARAPKMAEALAAQKKEVDESVKALTEESKKLGEASKAAAAAAKAAEEAVKKAKPEQAAEAQKAIEAANKAKADAEKAAKDADDALKMATDMAKSLDAQAKKATEAAKPKPVNLSQPVGTASLRVTESPVKVDAGAATAPLKVGQKVEHTVKVARHSGFDGDVTFEIKTPDELKGVTLAAPVVAKKGEGEAKITLASTDKTAPGTYTVIVRAKVSFGGQNLQSEVPVKVTVEK